MPVIRNRRRNEQGAIAVIYAILFLVLVSIAALATDLGNAISRKTSVQTQADVAALDAGQHLTQSVRAGTTIPVAVLQQVADSLNNNQPQDDDRACWRNEPADCVTLAMLTDGGVSNGEVYATDLGLRVLAPTTAVDFGLANAISIDGTNVVADATVNVFTAGRGIFPMFAVSGCDYGRQTLTDPAGGHTSSDPDVALPGDNGPADLFDLTVRNSSSAVVDHIPIGATGHSIWVRADDWNQTLKIGFFKDETTTVVDTMPMLNSATGVLAAPTPLDGNTPIVRLDVPASVAGSEGLWYVRAFSYNGNNAGNAKWSTIGGGNALPFRVGQSVLECTAGSTDGNFGTLRLPRTDHPTANDVALNIADGLQDPLNLVIHPWGKTQSETNATWNGECVHGEEGAVVSSGSTLRPDTNCVDTDPGLAANVATAGFVTGVRSGATVIAPGLLHQDTLCDSTGGTNERSVTIQSTTYQLNNDVLSCFLTSGHSLGEITSPTYNGGAALSADLLKSPRFGYVPVVAEQPGSGSSNTYSIIDFRPAFITDETPTVSAIKGSQTGTSDNGLTFQGNDLKQIKVVFFAFDALPRNTDGEVIDYLGVGDPIVRLVD